MGRSPAVLERPAFPPKGIPPIRPVPPLQNGDHLTREEFERRYEAMPEHVRAELIEGVVYLSSPVRAEGHGDETSSMDLWLGIYALHTRGTRVSSNATVELDDFNEPQPDISLRVLPRFGGQSGTSGGYIEGAPEFVAEVAASTKSIDLFEKKDAYHRNGVREYLVWRVLDGELDWFAWREAGYERLAPDESGVYRSEAFPGLWLDAPALLRDDMLQVERVLQRGLAGPEHEEFVARLTARAGD